MKIVLVLFLSMLGDWISLVKPLAAELGADTFGSVGTCWGSYPVVRYWQVLGSVRCQVLGVRKC